MESNKRIKFLLFCGILIFTCFMVQPACAQYYTPPFVTYTPVFDVTQRNLNEIVLDDGVYELTVNCKSHTGLDQNYTLDVRIQDDRVVQIYFNNGGSVHSGRNNSGYTWRGGGIQWNTDWYGNIQSGKAIMQVDYGNGQWQLFTIVFR